MAGIKLQMQFSNIDRKCASYFILFYSFDTPYCIASVQLCCNSSIIHIALFTIIYKWRKKECGVCCLLSIYIKLCMASTYIWFHMLNISTIQFTFEFECSSLFALTLNMEFSTWILCGFKRWMHDVEVLAWKCIAIAWLRSLIQQWALIFPMLTIMTIM